jgi:choline dehydrogenase-like flavoprotein
VICIVGSGPAGVACAHALVSRGIPVTMLDAGVEMEPDLRQVLTTMSAQPASAWNAADVDRIKRPTEASGRAIPLKAAYGSLFPYRHAAKRLSFDVNGVDASPSFARGGFSNVWGATVLPYHPRDIVDWPVRADELAPHYAAVAQLMHIAERHDRLAAQFPLFTDGSQRLTPSRQADALMRDLEANAEALERDGWRFGYSRLAVVANAGSSGGGCVYCGLCLYGCPYGLIYNASSTLDRLRRSAEFTYRPDVVVSRVEESGGGVRILGESRTTGEAVSLDADRVCLAAGVFNTTAILLASLEAYDAPLPILDSQLFLVPTLRYEGVPAVADEQLYTLSQIFVELMKPSISPKTIHMQVYSYNDWYVTAIKRRIGALFTLARPGLTALLSRLMAVQGYLPSELSPQIKATLRRAGAGHTLSLEAENNRRSAAAIDEIIGTLRRHRRHLRAMVLTPLLERGAPGRGYHTGGSFPMRAAPSRFESDRWGRPYGFDRVHVVDASVFPSIPSGPITFSVMANAHRIATECAGS